MDREQARGNRRSRWERLARLFSQSQQRQQVAKPGTAPPQLPLAVAAGLAPGWAGQSGPQAVGPGIQEP